MKSKNIDSKSKKVMYALYAKLGGRAFELSTGSRFESVYIDKDGNPVRIIRLKPNNWSGASKLKITYRFDKKNYKMVFYNRRYNSETGTTVNILVCERDNVAFDELRLTFIQVTNLFIHTDIFIDEEEGEYGYHL